jgi:hypothetical protein
MAAIPITSVSLSVLSLRGGEVLTIGGTFDTTKSYQAFIGPNGDDSDEPCYSGKHGDGYTIKPTSASSLACVTPPLDRGTGHVLSIYTVPAGDVGVWGAGCGAPLTAVEVMHRDLIFEVRRSWTREMDTGPRDLELEPRMDQ